MPRKAKFVLNDDVWSGHDLKEIITRDEGIQKLSDQNVLEYLGTNRRTIPIAFVNDDVAEVLQKVCGKCVSVRVNMVQMALMHTDKVFVVDEDHALLGIVSIEAMPK